MSQPSWARVGLGLGVAGLLVVGLAKAAGGASSSTRFINVKGTTIRIRRLSASVFEAAAWGEGIAFTDMPGTEPLATYTFSSGLPIGAAGNPIVIAFLHANLPDVPVKNLFDQPGSERCARPGCSV